MGETEQKSDKNCRRGPCCRRSSKKIGAAIQKITAINGFFAERSKRPRENDSQNKHPPISNEHVVLVQVRSLTERLAVAEETLRAVRSGEIDAFIVQGPDGEQVYALRSAEQPYRNLIEDMLEGAAILTTDGDIAYCNKRFAELVAVPLEEAVGGCMERFVHPADCPAYRSLLAAGQIPTRVRASDDFPEALGPSSANPIPASSENEMFETIGRSVPGANTVRSRTINL